MEVEMEAGEAVAGSLELVVERILADQVKGMMVEVKVLVGKECQCLYQVLATMGVLVVVIRQAGVALL